MELKLEGVVSPDSELILLIVPYGIETLKLLVLVDRLGRF